MPSMLSMIQPQVVNSGSSWIAASPIRLPQWQVRSRMPGRVHRRCHVRTAESSADRAPPPAEFLVTCRIFGSRLR